MPILLMRSAETIAATVIQSKAYKLAARTFYRGLPISIETKKGQTRKGVGADGKPWKVTMPFDYGYIRGTEGADGQHVDCFIGPDAEADNVFVIHQHKEDDNTAYDEDKVMFGFNSAAEAEKAYRSAYNIDIFQGMHTFNFPDFVEALYDKKNKGHALECGGPGSGEYVHKKGFHLAPLANRDAWPQHLKDMKIPPKATRVEYNPDAETKHLKAIWYDSKDRDHPIYHEDFENSQAEIKFTRVKDLLKERDKIRQQIADKAANEGKDKEHADCMSLVDKMGLRPGSENDTGAKEQAYGATTLEGRHVVTDEAGNTRLQFTGKDGVKIDLPVHPDVEAMLKDRKEKAGDSGQLFPSVSQESLGRFSHSLDGGSFKTKDFRTALGTETAQKAVDSMPVPTDEKEYKRAVAAVAKEVAAKLGNTPAMALKAYIAPQIWSKWRSHLAAA